MQILKILLEYSSRMSVREYEHLIAAETAILNSLISNGNITTSTLPLGLSIGLDSMGPMRSSTTDRLHPGAAESLGRFSETAIKYGLRIVVATNGPDIEGFDILNALSPQVSAFAVTEGGGKAILRDTFGYNRQQEMTDGTRQLVHVEPSYQLITSVMAADRDLEALGVLEQHVRKHPLMEALLGDINPQDGLPPIRTPYDTNIVLTLPAQYENLQRRLVSAGVDLGEFIPDVNASDYVSRTLSFAASQYRAAIANLHLNRDGDDLHLFDHCEVIVKGQNRRVYVTPMHLVNEAILNKYSGVQWASEMLIHQSPAYMRSNPSEAYELVERSKYRRENSVYVADKTVDTTGEGQQIISASERSMVIGREYFVTYQPAVGANILQRELLWSHDDSTQAFAADVTARVAINVTMDGSPPRMEYVERVPILHIGSGMKALEAITYLYERLHN